MFKIGEFSRLTHVPVPTLRLYDQVGLLTPVEVDRSTGYRYYAASQLSRLHRILALKGLGLYLEQIGAVLAEGLSLEEIRGMLRLRHAQISQELGAMQHQLDTVDARLLQIECEDRLPVHDVLLKQVTPRLVAAIRTIVPSHSAIGSLFGEWGARQGLKWDQFDDPNGDGFVARYESYLTDPGDQPDPAKWETEVVIRLADDRTA